MHPLVTKIQGSIPLEWLCLSIKSPISRVYSQFLPSFFGDSSIDLTKIFLDSLNFCASWAKITLFSSKHCISYSLDITGFLAKKPFYYFQIFFRFFKKFRELV